jgi:glycosyltransferase involved in cell wall biosynthesis
MKQKPTFVTVFTETENFHLVKDVGQLPYFMYKTEGYDATLISYQNNVEYPFIDQEVNGLKLNFIPNKGRFLYFELGVLYYLLNHSKSIAVLNLFHFKKDHILYLLIYKLVNPQGKAYIKLDMDILFFKNYNAFLFSNYALKNFILKALTSWIFKLTDLFSVETDQAKDYLLNVYPELQNKLICVPNGVDNLYLDKEIPIKAFQEKENIILTVGRIGTQQKNTALLLDALKITDLKDWKVYILGPIEESFKKYIADFYKEYPQLENKVIFTGNITDRKELFDWYNRSKIFCLSSRYEGFPIAFPEALYFGNYLISSPVSSAEHITSNGKYGTVARADAHEFSKAIQNSIEPGFLSSQRYEEIRRFSKDNFTWPGIVKKLADQIKS